jgi:hypothetical protein
LSSAAIQQWHHTSIVCNGCNRVGKAGTRGYYGMVSRSYVDALFYSCFRCLTQYELIVSVANAALNINTILATQFLQFTNAAACNTDDADDDGSNNCPNDTVDINGVNGYLASGGPTKFANYTYMLLGINIASTLIFTMFLPKQKEECHEWRKKGEAMGQSRVVGYISVFMATSVIAYGILASIMLLNVNTSCIPAFGGDGCSN